MKSSDYAEIEPLITEEYTNRLTNIIDEEWNSNKYPLLLINVPNLIFWNKSAQKFFTNNDIEMVQKFHNKTYIEILFLPEYGLRSNFINWDEFSYIIVRNLYAWNLVRKNEENFSFMINQFRKIPEFENHWEKLASENIKYPITYNIPFIFNHPIIGRVDFNFSTYLLYEDKRFLVEQFSPVNLGSVNKLEEYLK